MFTILFMLLLAAPLLMLVSGWVARSRSHSGDLPRATEGGDPTA